jgi:hypothetical protein
MKRKRKNKAMHFGVERSSEFKKEHFNGEVLLLLD